MTPRKNDKAVRNILFFYLGTLLLAAAGGLMTASGQEAGGLVFILSPLVMVLTVRSLFGDGWQDAGLGLKLKKSWGWYLFALLAMPVVFLVVIAINISLGFTTLSLSVSGLLSVLLAGFAVQLIPRMLFALSEEWAWRGYLEPRFERLGLPHMKRHIVVGVLWGIWHFPLILSTDYTSIPLLIFLPLFLIGVILLAILYGQMQRFSGTVWPAVLLHGMGNALGYAILEGNIIAFNNELFGNIIPGSIITTLVYGLVVFLIWQRNNETQAQEIEIAEPVQSPG